MNQESKTSGKSLISLNKDTEKKPHNTADTSKEAFKIINARGQIIKEQKQVFEAIQEHQPCTSRMLMKLAKLERGNITRCLFDLVNAEKPLVKIAFKDKCKVTGITVNYYSLTNWEDKENAR